MAAAMFPNAAPTNAVEDSIESSINDWNIDSNAGVQKSGTDCSVVCLQSAQALQPTAAYTSMPRATGNQSVSEDHGNHQTLDADTFMLQQTDMNCFGTQPAAPLIISNHDGPQSQKSPPCTPGDVSLPIKNTPASGMVDFDTRPLCKRFDDPLGHLDSWVPPLVSCGQSLGSADLHAFLFGNLHDADPHAYSTQPDPRSHQSKLPEGANVARKGSDASNHSAPDTLAFPPFAAYKKGKGILDGTIATSRKLFDTRGNSPGKYVQPPLAFSTFSVVFSYFPERLLSRASQGYCINNL